MKIIHNKYIPFGTYSTINLFGFLFTKKKYLDKITVNHERIHSLQQKGLLYIFFYILYFLEWIIRLIQYRNTKAAYYAISFEKDAYINEENFRYDKLYGWFKYL